MPAAIFRKKIVPIFDFYLIRETDKSEFGGNGRSEGTGDVILHSTRSPDGEVTDKSEFEGFKQIPPQPTLEAVKTMALPLGELARSD